MTSPTSLATNDRPVLVTLAFTSNVSLAVGNGSSLVNATLSKAGVWIGMTVVESLAAPRGAGSCESTIVPLKILLVKVSPP